jgi:hypothetical protein
MIHTTPIVAVLPDCNHYQLIERSQSYYRFKDKATDKIRILAPVPEPFNQEWLIFPRIDHGRSRGVAREKEVYYPSRLNLLLKPIEGAQQKQKGQILRERWKGNFAHSCEPTLMFFVFYLEGELMPWLTYSFIGGEDDPLHA